MQYESPVNPIPPVILALCLIVVGVELVLNFAAQGIVGGVSGGSWRLDAVLDYGFQPGVIEWMIERGDYSFELLKRFVTYPFIHGSFTNALFGAAILLALGKFVGDVFHPVAVLVVFFASAIIGATFYGLFGAGDYPLFGVMTPVYGLIGAFTYILWLKLGASGQNRLAAFRLIGFLLALQLVFGVFFGSSSVWIAELAGFATGFSLSTVLAPGGWAALVHRLRQR